ncbi:unnamed protein product [Ambrosiozyma monospora]|uniref:Unnamed protein product n=1 Tax=Ambrosiozyma monospora TaxID=43982 RepID=A0A9W7DJG2_AMBMO|nr:unnamed protein product [Ambrosiozyma monospora]
MIVDDEPVKKKTTTRKSKTAGSSTKKKAGVSKNTKAAVSTTAGTTPSKKTTTKKSATKKTPITTTITETHSKSYGLEPKSKHAIPQDFYTSDPIIDSRPLSLDQDIDLSILNDPIPFSSFSASAPPSSHGKFMPLKNSRGGRAFNRY